MIAPDTGAPRPSRRGAGRWLLVGALGLAAAVAALWLPRRPRVPTPGPAPSPAATSILRPSVAILGLRSLADRERWLSTAVPELLASELAAGGRLRVVPGETVARVQAEMGLSTDDDVSPERLTQVAANVAAGHLVLGAYDARGGGRPVRVRLRLVEAASRRDVVAFEDEAASLAGLPGLVTRAGARLRAALGVAPLPTDAAPRAAPLPSDLAAARLYAEGLARLRLFDALAARDLLGQAVAAAPDHPLVRLALAEAWTALGFDLRARDEARRALEGAGTLALTDRLLIEARLHELSGDRGQAAEIYRTLRQLFPDDLEAGLKLAAALTSAARREEALAIVEELRDLPPPARDDPRIDIEEARAANALGEYRRGEAAAARAAAKGSARGARLLVARARLLEAYAFRAQGSVGRAVAANEEAQRLFAEAGDRQGVAQALLETATLLRYRGDLDRAKALAEESLGVARAIGDQRGMAWARNRIASVLAEQGRLSAARQMYQEALEGLRSVGDRSGEGTALNNVGETLWKEADPARARPVLERAVALFREIGSKRGLSFALFNLGFVLLDQGDLTAAGAAFEESLAVSRSIGEKSLSAVALHGLGRLRLVQDDLPRARQAHEEALALRKGLGERGRAAESLMALSAVAGEEARWAEAEAAARDAADEFHAERADHQEALARALLARALVGQRRTEEASLALGQAMTLAAGAEYRGVRLSVSLAAARLRASALRPAEAVRMLAGVVHEARKRGLVGIEVEARLALGEIEKRFGDPAAGDDALETLAREARSRGFALVARRAERARTGSPDL